MVSGTCDEAHAADVLLGLGLLQPLFELCFYHWIQHLGASLKQIGRSDADPAASIVNQWYDQTILAFIKTPTIHSKCKQRGLE